MPSTSATLWNDIWAHHWYADEGRRLRRASQKFLAVCNHLRPTPHRDSYAAEIGCGSGHFLQNAIDANLAEYYVGGDFSSTALRLAACTLEAAASNCSLINCDATKMPFKDDAFDFLFLVCVIEHIDTKQPALIEASRLLTHDGKLIIFYSNSRSAFAWERFIKSKFFAWPFGYQDEMDINNLTTLLRSHQLNVTTYGIIQGDWDFPILRLIDLAFSLFDPTWGRYNFAIAEPTND